MIASLKPNPWYSPCNWKAYGLEWRFEYNEYAAKRTITAPGFTLSVPIVDTARFPSPQAWLEAGAKKNKKRFEPPHQELELDLTEAQEAWQIGERVPSSPVEYLNLDEIRRNGGTQPRAKIDLQHVKRLEEQIEDGHELEPAVVFYDGEFYWLADGFHRWHAHHNQAALVMPCLIHQGSRRDAVLYSVGANAEHKPALPRSREDKRRAVLTLLQDPEWKEWSDREISRQCKVSDRTVNRLRQSICDHDADTKLNIERQVRRGGPTYTLNTTNIGKRSHEDASADHNGRVTVTGDRFLWGQSGTIAQIPNPRQAIVQLDSGERELVNLRHLVWERTQAPITKPEALAALEVNSEVEYSRSSERDLPDVTQSSSVAPQKVEVNTNDILIAFISNLDYMSEAQVEAAVRAIAQSHPLLIRQVMEQEES